VIPDEGSAEQDDYNAQAHGAQPHPHTTTSSLNELHYQLETLYLREIVCYRMLDTRR